MARVHLHATVAERCSMRHLVYVHISSQAFNGLVNKNSYPSLYIIPAYISIEMLVHLLYQLYCWTVTETEPISYMKSDIRPMKNYLSNLSIPSDLRKQEIQFLYFCGTRNRMMHAL